MASTSLEIVISANDQFSAKADRVIGKLHGIGTSAKQVGKGVGELGVGLARVGVVGFGALAGGLAAAAKAGIDFEDAFAGVRKTVGGDGKVTKAALDGIYESLRKLATRIPVKFTDLASIATEAGALGVPAAEIVHFTEVIARLSSATQGLTVEAASEAIGKLGNILHIHGNDVDRFASSLVALGNAGASTEADIIETAKRFGAAGSAAKLTAAQVLGFSSAIASLGVEPEAAGSALSRIFNKVTLYIGTGNDKLKQFAQTAGLSEAAFSKLFKGDSTKGLLAFLQGLGKLDRFQVAKVLKAAGITNIRDINAIQLLSQNYGLLTDQLGVSTDAFAKNTALTEASTQRFGTLKSKLELVKNTVLDAGVSIAQGLNPAIGRLADKLSTFVTAHKDDFIKFGADIGKFIDEIDWSKVQRGAETFVDVMKTLLTIVQKIPPEIDAAVAAFLGINKVSGGLLGKGLGDIAGGLTGLITRGIGSLLPGKLGGVVGALTAQPVFVTNWPLGGFGGGIPTPGGAPGGGGLLSALGSAISFGLKGIVLPVAIGLAIDEFMVALAHQFLPRSATPEQIDANFATRPTGEGGRTGGRGGTSFHDGSGFGPVQTVRAGDGGDGRGMAATLAPVITRSTSAATMSIKDDIRGLGALLAKARSSEFLALAAALAHPKSPAAMLKAADGITKLIGQGRGGAEQTAHVLASLKTALKNTHDPKTAASLRADIRKVEGLLPGRQFAAQELSNAKQILSSHKTTAQKIAGLQTIERDLVHRGLPHAASVIRAKIEEAKRAQVEKQRQTTQAIKDKQLAVTFQNNAYFNGRLVNSNLTRYTTRAELSNSGASAGR